MSFVLDLLVQMQPQLLIGAVLLGFTWLHLVTAVAIEMADILQVPIFAVPQSKAKKSACARVYELTEGPRMGKTPMTPFLNVPAIAG